MLSFAWPAQIPIDPTDIGAPEPAVDPVPPLWPATAEDIPAFVPATFIETPFVALVPACPASPVLPAIALPVPVNPAVPACVGGAPPDIALGSADTPCCG
jgi:hypothetical protein